jgi:hypothetical protein
MTTRPPKIPDAPEPGRTTPARIEETGSAVAPLRAPLETIAHAMKTQVELLRQMQDRQRALEDAVRDEKRHELMINSAQSLNDAFRGMQQSQERLADRLEEPAPMSGRRWILLGVAVLVVVGAIVVLALVVNRGADGLGDLAQKMDVPRNDVEARAAIAEMGARIKTVEAADRQAFQNELERLRRATDASASERDQLRKERDQAREELGSLRGKASDADRQVTELKAKQEAADKEIARLTTQSVGDQRLISQLNNTLEVLKSRSGPPAPSPSSTGGASPETSEPAAPAVHGTSEAPTPERSLGTDTAPAETEGAREMPFTQGQRDDLNRLLGRHRGRQTYSLVSAVKIADRTLKNVVLEVRGADGSRDKTIEAESMTVKISPRGEMADLDFVKGSIVFHSSVAGRDARSPFFNDRYQIVLLGAPSKDWLTAGLAFVSMR